MRKMRNHVAKELWTPKYRPRVEKNKKEKLLEQEMEDTKLESMEAIFSDEEDWD